MKTKKQRNKNKYVWTLASFGLAVACFIVLAVRIWTDRNTEIVLTIDGISGTTKVNTWIEVTKSWNDYDEHRVPCIGAQYDGFVENHMKTVLMDWQMKIYLPAEARIDSSWNGEYVNEGNYIVFTPDPTLDIGWIEPGATEGFGFILYSKELLDIHKFVITGHQYAKIVDYPWFYFGLLFVVAACIMLAWRITFDMRTRQMEQRRINDEKIIVETMLTLANFIDAKDEYTKGHSVRVSAYSVKIAEQMHMDEEKIRNLGYIALMHDCGKMGVPDHILNKPDKLTPEERSVMEQHTVLGGKLLEHMTAIEGIREGALSHHERYDGKGYPNGLSGKDIPLYARIIGVADSFDAMNSDRCYRKRLPMEVIKEELRNNAGKQFDPEIVKYMLHIIEEGDLIS